MSVVLGLGNSQVAHAETPAAVNTVDRELVVTAWRLGGPLVRAAAEDALLGSDAEVESFLSTGWAQRAGIDDRISVNRMMAGGGTAVQGAAQAALDSTDATALTRFLETGWRLPAGIDQRIRVNQMLAAGGTQVKVAAQKALDADATEDPADGTHAALTTFLDTGWASPHLMDLRLRVNQIMSAARTNGSSTVEAAAQRALNLATMDALSEFIDSGWAIAASRDQEISVLKDLVSAAQEAQKRTAQQTQLAKDESARAVAAAAAAKKAAQAASDAMDSAQGNAKAAAAAAQQAANAANNAAAAARQAVAASQAAIAAARVAANAASRAAAAAAMTRRAATKAQKAAAAAATDASKANDAKNAAKEARDVAVQAQKAADASGEAEKIMNDLIASAGVVKDAGDKAMEAADASEDAARRAGQTGVNTQQAVEAAQRARANANRASRAAAASLAFAREAAAAAGRSRNAANRAIADAIAAAAAAEDAAAHAGDATQAAQRATAAANEAVLGANEAIAAAEEAKKVYDAAREADVQRLAVSFDEGEEAALAASAKWAAYRQQLAWDAGEAAKRSAATNQLIAEVTNPATPREVATNGARKVALALTASDGSWTRQAAVDALGGSDETVLDFVRNGIAAAAALDDRVTVASLGATGSVAMNAAAEAALAGTDADVAAFLRDQNYPGRTAEDRVGVNQILADAKGAGRTVTTQKAQAALDVGTDQVLRDFLRTGQYSASEADDRVEANRVLTGAVEGTELRAAAQIALDGPPPALQQFLDSGRHKAAQNDYDTAAHNSEVSALLSQARAVASSGVVRLVG